MQIQWYPGHMAKARRMLEGSVKLVDVIVELCDARAPLATRNPDFDTIFRQRTRVLILNKADLAENGKTRAWIEYFQKNDLPAMRYDARAKKGVQDVAELIRSAAKEKIDRKAAKGAKATVRAMLVGIPNVGKSTLVNALKGQSAAKTGDRPGVTRGGQWIAVNDYLEMLDTPGMLWPKLEDPQSALRLAMIGSVPDDVVNEEELASLTLQWLWENRPEAAAQRFKVQTPPEHPELWLEAACKGRGWIMGGGRPDLTRGAHIVLDEFRAGKLGPITLQNPPGSPAGQ